MPERASTAGGSPLPCRSRTGDKPSAFRDNGEPPAPFAPHRTGGRRDGGNPTPAERIRSGFGDALRDGATPSGGTVLQFRLMALAALQALAITGLSTLIPAYLARAGADDFLIGLSFTAWAVTRGGFGLIAGRAYERFGPRRLLTLALLLFSLATGGYATAHAPNLLVALRLVQGVAAGLYWTSLLATAAAGVGPAARLGALMRINIVAAAAGLASNVIAGAIAAAWSPTAFFWLETALLLGVGVPLALSLRRDRSPAPAQLPAALLETAAATDPGAAPGRAGIAPRTAVPIGPLQRRQVALAALGSLALVIPAVGAPVLLAHTVGGYRLVGAVGAAMILANIAAQGLAPWLSARLGSRRLLCTLGATAALLLCSLALDRGTAATAAMCVLLSGVLSLWALTWLAWAQSGIAAQAIGRLTGLFRGVGDLSSVIAYTAFGLIAAHLGPALWLLALTVAASGVGALTLRG